MVRDFASTDYSEWVASVIAGSIETEFEANVFEYLSTLKDRRYLNEAAGRFVKILNNSSSTGFAAQTSRDAFITGALSLYIIQFPGDNAVLRNALGGKVDQFIGLSEKTLTEIRGIPLNQAYIYLYLKYFGLEELINKKMEIFFNTGTTTWDGRTWDMKAVNSLINYFTSVGKGMSQNFYSLIRTGFTKNDSVRIYIALQVLKKIGFNDPDTSYSNLLNRVSRRESDLEIITETRIGGRSTRSTREIIFADEVAELRRAITGKQDTPFEEMLNNALKTSSQNGKFILPPVSAMEVIEKEISEIGGQYTNAYIVEKTRLWEKKNDLLEKARIMAMVVAVAACSIILNKTAAKYKRNGRLSSLVIPHCFGVSIIILLSHMINMAIATMGK
jgi:hypothetical protein